MAIADEIAAIRNAIFGKDVRDAIANGIAECYSDVSNAKTIAKDAATSAGNAAETALNSAATANQYAQEAHTAAEEVNDIILVQPDTPSQRTNKLWVDSDSTSEVTVPTIEEFNGLKSAFDDLLSGTVFDYSNVTTSKKSINGAGNWTSSVSYKTYTFAIDDTVSEITITAGNTDALIAFLNSVNDSVGTRADFATGYTSRVTIPANTTQTYTITGNMNYMFAFLQDTSSGTNRTPTVVLMHFKTDKTLTQEYVAADAKVVGDTIEAVATKVDKLFEEVTFDYSRVTTSIKSINSAGNWVQSVFDKTYTFAIDAVTKIVVTAGDTDALIAFLNSYADNPTGSADFSTAYPSRITIPANETQTYIVNGNMNYLYAFLEDTDDHIDRTPTVVLTQARPTAINNNITNSYTNQNTNTYNTDIEENTYNVQATPSITSEALYYVAPDPNGADQTLEIATMLSTNGVCRLGSGTYYIGNLDMPVSSSIIGIGASTVIHLLDSITNGYAIKMNTRCCVKDLRIVGADSYTAQTLNAQTPGNRTGILWTGTGMETIPAYGIVSNVRFEYIQGSGIKCVDTSQVYRRKIEVANCYFMWCDAGVNIERESEFNQFINCTFGGCYYGAINNGGNNYFCNCNFTSNIKQFVIDNSSGTLPNVAHSGITSCDFAHAMGIDEEGHTTSNQGTHIEILGIGNYGFSFIGCNLGFGKVNLVDSGGIMFEGCTWAGAAYNNIYITRGSGVFFNSCLFGSQYSFNIVDNTKVKFFNCWTKDGSTEVTGN